MMLPFRKDSPLHFLYKSCFEGVFIDRCQLWRSLNINTHFYNYDCQIENGLGAQKEHLLSEFGIIFIFSTAPEWGGRFALL